jgi:hypothetical protein
MGCAMPLHISDNLPASANVYSEEPEVLMSLLSKLFGSKPEPRKRIRVCVECGMPVEEHKDWCAIRRGAEELAGRPVRPATPA